MSRNKTNLLLKNLALMIEENNDTPVDITIVVGGQLISGTMITETEFFALPDNSDLQEHFIEQIKNPRENTLDQINNGIMVELSDQLKEIFIYLKNVRYIFGSDSVSAAGENGMSAQVRISDISVFTYRGLKG